MADPIQGPQSDEPVAAEQQQGTVSQHAPALQETVPFDPAMRPAAPATAAPAVPLGQIGDYELVREIAHGGMGVVYEARHRTLHRTVALKMIRAGELADAEHIERFRREAEAAAQLDHSGIVAIYEVGHDRGRHYFAMAYVDGTSLHARLQKGPLPAQEAARIVQVVAEAVAFAHAKQIVHRDLKPHNILLDRQGQPKVADFGLAKRLDAADGYTASGAILGTPNYMAPEQALSQTKDLGPAVDVYGLGGVLYATLTGRPPFQAAAVADILCQVIEREPAAPRLLNAAVPRDLETICLKCLEKKPQRRYASCHEVAEELGRYLRGEPIHARPVSQPERFWRWCQRNPVVAGLSAAAAMLLVLVAVVASLGYWSTSRALATADDALARETAALQEMQIQKRRADAAKAVLLPPFAEEIPRGEWVDLLGRVDVRRDAAEGAGDFWHREGNGIRGVRRDQLATLLLPVELQEAEFDLQYEFTEHVQYGRNPWHGARLSVPAGHEEVPLVLGPMHSVLGSKAEPKKLALGRRYRVLLKARPVGDEMVLAALLDDEPHLEWRYKSVVPSSAAPSSAAQRPGAGRGHPAIGVKECDAVFHSVQLRLLSGRAHFTHPDPAAPAKELPAGKSADLLPRIVFGRDVLCGEWKWNGMELVGAPGYGLMAMLPTAIAGDYDLHVQFTRHMGEDSVDLLCPVGDSAVNVKFSGSFGTVCGLESVEGQRLPNNPTLRRPSVLQNGHQYTVLVQVRTEGDHARIEVSLDGDLQVRWSGKHSYLSLPDVWHGAKPNRPAVGAWGCGVSFQRARLEMISGTAALLPAAAHSTATTATSPTE